MPMIWSPLPGRESGMGKNKKEILDKPSWARFSMPMPWSISSQKKFS